MKTIGIKLADGSFYPVLEDNTPSEKKLELTTAHNNQTKVMVDLYRSATCSMDDAEYVDSLQIENLVARPNGEADIKFTISLDEDNQLSAKIVDSETGNESNTTITLVSRTLEERLVTDEYGINDSNSNKAGAVAAGAVAAGGLLAAAAAMREKVKDETEVEEEPVVENVDDGVPFGDETLVEEAAVEESVSNEEISADETIIDETFDDEALADDTITEDNSGLPDMDFDIPDDTTETETPEMPDDFFNTDDLDNTEERQETMKDPTFDSVSPAAGGLNFDGLYDEETERGTPAENGADEVKKKTKVPVIICIICAIICIIATLLILFIIPSKYNLITKKHAKEAGTTVSIEEPAPEAEPILEPEPEPVVPEAKEDEIIIIEKAEEVVPAQPPVAEEKPKNITYKIKWGDTLWDIADTYYKNPWKYKYIARYNGIKNPDYIISGTKIVIPAEQETNALY